MTDLSLIERRRGELTPVDHASPKATPWPSLRRPLLMALAVIGLFFGGFVGWASLAPLDSAVIARGVVSPAGSRRTVQHLEGGVISDIKVKDGDRVQAGDTLLTMNDTQSDAAYKVTERRLLTMQVTLARLLAERSSAAAISYSADVADAPDANLANIMQEQQNLFETRRQAVESQQAILAQQMAQMQEQITGYSQQVASAARQLELIGSETRDVETLIAKGLERRPRLLALQRAMAALEGQKSATQAAIAQARQKIGEIQLQSATVDTTRRNEVDDQIAKIQTDLVQYNETLRAQQDVRSRALLAAPVPGTVVNLRFKSAGGVIQPGEAVLDIVPDEEDLLIDAHISPLDIDSVKVGQNAEVILSSYRLKFLPRTIGEVTYVSADSLRDATTGGNYYEVKVRVSPAEKDKLDRMEPPVRLVAGMPAEVFVVTGQTYVMAYLLNPLVELIRRTFRESDSI